MTIEQWDSKDPDESDRFGIDWRPRLAGSTIVASRWFLVIPAGLTLADEQFDDHFATMLLSGGTAGEVAEILNRIDTADGRENLEETRRLPIVSSAGADAGGYVVPGPAQFITRYPRFAQTDPDAIADALAEAATRVDTTWVEADFARAIMLYAAHVLTMDGHGSGTEAQLAGLGDFQRIESGGLKLSRFDRFFTPGVMASTSYGKRFAELQRLNFAGPRVVPGLGCRPCHPGATDC